jgi:hypothetical protein
LTISNFRTIELRFGTCDSPISPISPSATVNAGFSQISASTNSPIENPRGLPTCQIQRQLLNKN